MEYLDFVPNDWPLAKNFIYTRDLAVRSTSYWTSSILIAGEDTINDNRDPSCESRIRDVTLLISKRDLGISEIFTSLFPPVVRHRHEDLYVHTFVTRWIMWAIKKIKAHYWSISFSPFISFVSIFFYRSDIFKIFFLHSVLSRTPTFIKNHLRECAEPLRFSDEKSYDVR